MPEPELRCETEGRWLEFAFVPAHSEVLRAGQKQAEQIEAQVTAEVTEQAEPLMTLLRDQRACKR